MVTFVQLKDGSWGLKGKNLKEGKTVTVTKKNGEQKRVVIGKVLRTENGLDVTRVGDGTPEPLNTRNPSPRQARRLDRDPVEAYWWAEDNDQFDLAEEIWESMDSADRARARL